MIYNCAVLIISVMICLVNSETKWIEIPSPQTLQPILWSNGTFVYQPLPEGVYSCGIGPGVVFFAEEGVECPSSRSIAIPYGSANQVWRSSTICFDAQITIIRPESFDRVPDGEGQAAFNALSRGCTHDEEPKVNYGSVTTEKKGAYNRAIVSPSTSISLDSTVFCSAETLICTQNLFITGLSSEVVYYAKDFGAKGYLTGDTRSKGVVGPQIPVYDINHVMPGPTTQVTGKPIGIMTTHLLSSGLKHIPRNKREKRAVGTTLASVTLAYVIRVKKATEASLKVVDKNFAKTADAINELNQYAYAQATIMKSYMTSIPGNMLVARSLETKNKLLLEVVDELANTADNIVDYSLTLLQKMQELEFDREQTIDEIKDQIGQEYPEWDIKQITFESDLYLVRLEKDGFLNAEAPELECSNEVCYLSGKWYHYRGNEILTVEDGYIDYLTCGLFFQDEESYTVLEVTSNIDTAIRYLNQYKIPYVSPTKAACQARLTIPTSPLLRELKERMELMNEGRIVLNPDGDFKLECSENGTLRAKHPIACDNYMRHNALYTILDTISPDKIAFQKVADIFAENTDGLGTLSEVMSNLGEAGGEVIGTLSDLGGSFLKALPGKTKGMEDRQIILFVLTGIGLAALAFLYFLELRKRLDGDKTPTQE